MAALTLLTIKLGNLAGHPTQSRSSRPSRKLLQRRRRRRPRRSEPIPPVSEAHLGLNMEARMVMHPKCLTCENEMDRISADKKDFIRNNSFFNLSQPDISDIPTDDTYTCQSMYHAKVHVYIQTLYK